MHERPYWHKQLPNQPLYAEMLWSRPENKAYAGNLLIVGGNAMGFKAPAEAYNYALASGIGTARVLLPDAIAKSIGPILESGEFAPSTPSGSLALKSLSELLDCAAWADGVVIPGDLGRNSETAILLERFLAKYTGYVTLSKDAAAYALSTPAIVLDRPNSLLLLTMADLQRLVVNTHSKTAITLDMSLLKLIDELHEITSQHTVSLMIRHLDTIIVAIGGQVSTTKTVGSTWRVKTAVSASVWQLQNPGDNFKAITTSLVA